MTCPESHSHNGTCYRTHRCRCDACHRYVADEQDRRRRRIAYGRYQSSLVDVGPVLEHIAVLRAVGMGLQQIARLSGVPQPTLRTATAPSRRQALMRRDSAAAVLAVRPDPALLAGGQHCDPLGARRRLQALVAEGWPQAALMRELHGSAATMYRTLHQRDRATTVEFHNRVAAFYEHAFSMTIPASKRSQDMARRRALALGWAPALAWDDIDTDPAPYHDRARLKVSVDEIAVELACNGAPIGRRLFPAEVRLAIPILHRRHYSDALIAHYLGVDERTVCRVRREELHLDGWAYDQTIKLTRYGEAA